MTERLADIKGGDVALANDARLDQVGPDVDERGDDLGWVDEL
jgi:hypothetical protein